VGLFLVISGFSIHMRWAARRDQKMEPRAFWRRRFIRLYPTYYVALALVVVTTLVVFGSGRLAAENGLRHGLPGPFAFVNHLAVVGGNVWVIAFLPHAWSLALEEQIYAVYTAVMWRWRQIEPFRLLAIAFAVSFVWRVGASVLLPTGTARDLRCYHLPSRGFEWVLGFVAAEAYHHRVRLPRLCRRLDVGLAVLVIAGRVALHPVGGLTIGHHFYLS